MSNKTLNSYPIPNNPSLQQKIVEIVNENSGGIKYTELISILTSKNIVATDFNGYADKMLHDVEWYCRNTKSIKTLDYTMKSMNRAKMFIYTQ
jgi:hypothetical protein